jgi:hypothetical protein
VCCSLCGYCADTFGSVLEVRVVVMVTNDLTTSPFGNCDDESAFLVDSCWLFTAAAAFDFLILTR